MHSRQKRLVFLTAAFLAGSAALAMAQSGGGSSSGSAGGRQRSAR